MSKVEIDCEGAAKTIVIPKGMPIEEARKILAAREESDNTVEVVENLNVGVNEGAVAFAKALKEKYGWVTLTPIPGFFGENPPQMMTVEIGFEEFVQVPWGNCKVPQIDGEIRTTYKTIDGINQFQIRALVKRKHEAEVHDIAERVREIVKTDSIYRNKVTKINFRDIDGYHEEMVHPKFIDLKTVAKQDPVYSAEVSRMLDVNLFMPVEKSAECRKFGIPLKRAVLLSGTFGTGKTLAAYKLARKCVEHGWTFIYLEDARDIHLCLKFARSYEPCVVFTEDVERATAGPRTSDIDKVLNTMDGIDTKDSEILLVLTTNNIDMIHPAFCRPGRIDAVIEIGPPDEGAILEIIKNYQNGDVKLDVTDKEILTALCPLIGANAAFIREAGERAKLAAIKHSSSESNEIVIKKEDLEIAAASLVKQVAIIQPFMNLKLEQINPLDVAMQVIQESFIQRFIERITDPNALARMFKKKQNPLNN